MDTNSSYESRRTSPLALWRYSHEYISVVRHLCGQLRIASSESQVPYHVAAQGIEFALMAFLRTRGATMSELQFEIGHSLDRALERCEAQGLPTIPAPSRAAIVAVAPFHLDGQFVYQTVSNTAFPDVEPLIDAGVWILDQIAPDVVEHFVLHHANESTPSAFEYVRRLRDALSWTSKSAASHSSECPDSQVFNGSPDARLRPDNPRAT